jgi:hypothetical protein
MKNIETENIVNLYVDYDTLTKNSLSDSISGNIYWQFGNRYFPEIGWYDYVSTLLMWWTSSLLDISNGTIEKVTFQFMDGPYFIKLLQNPSCCLHVQFFDHEVLQDECVTNLNILLNKIFLVSTRVLDWYKKNIKNDVASLVIHEMLTIESNCHAIKRRMFHPCSMIVSSPKIDK